MQLGLLTGSGVSARTPTCAQGRSAHPPASAFLAVTVSSPVSPCCSLPATRNGELPLRGAHATTRLSHVVCPGALQRRTQLTPPSRQVLGTRRSVAGVREAPLVGDLPQERFRKVDVSETVLLQGFGWDSWNWQGGWYNHLRSQVGAIAKAGFTHIWLPPPSQSVSREGYLPVEMYDLNTPYGNQGELQALCRELKHAGVTPMADLVLNHRSAGAKGPDGRWNQFTDRIDHPGARLDWGAWAITSCDPDFGGTGSMDTGEDFGAAPDVDHSNDFVRLGYKDWMRWLHEEVGFAGWRFDYVKGYAARYVAEYIRDTLGNDGVFHVSEYWTDLLWERTDNDVTLSLDQDAARQALCDYCDAAGGSTFMFDFPLKGMLNAAVANNEYGRLRDIHGKAPGLLGWWPERAVTFVDNHDTGSSQQHWPFPAERMEQGYAYILTHPGVPSVLWEDYAKPCMRPIVDCLLALRRRAGIKSWARLDILEADDDIYVACINGNVILKMGPRMDMGELLPKEEEGWVCACSGHDWAAWERVDRPHAA